MAFRKYASGDISLQKITSGEPAVFIRGRWDALGKIFLFVMFIFYKLLHAAKVGDFMFLYGKQLHGIGEIYASTY